MTALTADRAQTFKDFKSLRFPAAIDVYYQGAFVCWDVSAARAIVSQAGADLIPLGTVTEQTTITVDADPLVVTLVKPVRGIWMANSAASAFTANDLLILAYGEDDQTVRKVNTAEGYSALGIAWAYDATKGVLVEPSAALAIAVTRLIALEP